MQTVKAEVIDMIQSLPDNSTIDEISYHLYVRSKVARGLTGMASNHFRL